MLYRLRALITRRNRMDSESGSVRSHLDGVAPKRRQDAEIDVSVLEAIVAESYRTLATDIYGLRAREGAGRPPDE
jgi:hypothetical protein